jgi:sarcosine oxidase subunit alpha
MAVHRIQIHPVLGAHIDRPKARFTFDGQELEGYAGEPIAAALLASDIRVLRRHEESGSARGIYCAIGHCMECRVEINGETPARACITPLKSGMTILSGRQLANDITGRKVQHDI